MVHNSIDGGGTHKHNFFRYNTFAYRKHTLYNDIFAECVYYANIAHVPAFQFDISIFLDLKEREKTILLIFFFFFAKPLDRRRL